MALVEISGLTKEYYKGGETITPLREADLTIAEG